MRNAAFAFALLMVLSGCGSSPTTESVVSSAPARARVTAADGVTASLRPGWNAVGLQVQRVSAVTEGPTAGLAFWDGTSYQTRAVTPETLNEGEGTRRGLYLYATEAGSLTYAGTSDSAGRFVELKTGWNLVSFATPTAFPLTDLRPLDSVLVPFTEIQPDGSYRTVDRGGSLQPGRAYWVYAAGTTRLTWEGSAPTPSPTPAAPSPTPEPSPSPEGFGGGGGGGGGGGFPAPLPGPTPFPTVRPTPTPSPVPGMLSGSLAFPYPTNSPHQMAAADFNLDGQVDMAQAANGRICVNLQENGFFKQTLSINPGGFQFERILTSDFNQDGKPDFMCYSNGNWRILIGDGTGQFTMTSMSVASAQSVVCGDFNRDGRPDLIAVGNDGGGSTVTVCLGVGTGAFTTSTFTITGRDCAAAAGDVNKDGMLDLVLCDGGSTQTWRYLGNGDGTFGTPSTFVRWDPTYGAVLADLDGDGNLDLASQDSTRMSILLGDGLGGFGPLQVLTGSTGAYQPDAVVAGDFNADGRTDLVSYDPAGNGSVRFYAGQAGTIPAAPVSTTPPGREINHIATGDLNGDGRLDLLITQGNQYSIVWPGRPGGPFPPTAATTASGATVMTAADFNGDGKADVALGHSTGVVTRLLSDGVGGFGTSLQVSSLGAPVALLSGDLNGDSAQDLVSLLSDGSVYASRGLGDGTFAVPVLAATTANPPVKAVLKDLTGDGKLDLSVAGASTVEILPGNGNGTFSASFGSYATLITPLGALTGDFNGDGKADLGILDTAGARLVALLGPVFGSPLTTPLASGLQIASVELSGDTRDDLALALSSGSNRVQPLTSNGDGTFTAGTAVGPGGTITGITAGRINADSRGDVVVSETNGGFTYVWALLNGGGGTFSSQRYVGGSATTALLSADVTGDGKTDFIKLEAASNQVRTLVNN